MGIAGMFVGLVALVQGVAWAGADRKRGTRRMQGAMLAPVGLLLFVLALLHLLVPGFLAG